MDELSARLTQRHANALENAANLLRKLLERHAREKKVIVDSSYLLESVERYRLATYVELTGSRPVSPRMKDAIDENLGRINALIDFLKRDDFEERKDTQKLILAMHEIIYCEETHLLTLAAAIEKLDAEAAELKQLKASISTRKR